MEGRDRLSSGKHAPPKPLLCCEFCRAYLTKEMSSFPCAPCAFRTQNSTMRERGPGPAWPLAAR